MLSLHLSRLNFGLSQKKMKKSPSKPSVELSRVKGIAKNHHKVFHVLRWGCSIEGQKKMSLFEIFRVGTVWNNSLFFFLGCNFRGSWGNKCLSNGKTDDRWPAKRIRLPGIVKNRGTFLHWIFNFQNTNVWSGTLGMLAIMACQEYMCSPIWRTDWWAKTSAIQKGL